MKLLLYADNHFSKYSSILRSRGEKYSKRLENQIQSLNWVEKLAKEQECDAIVCLGDFFDKPSLDAEEISALKDVEWDKSTRRVFLVGNHELGTSADEYNSANLFSLIENSEVISKPMAMLDGDTLILLLPYLLEVNDGTLHKIIPQWITDKEKDLFKRTIILSHNDLKGVQYGAYVSKSGLSLSEINECCDLFINGHIHNGDWVDKKIFNLGNLTGQNFSENVSKIYGHGVCILDTKTLETQFILNPYAIYFKKMEYYDYLENRGCSNPLVLSLSCKDKDVERVKKYCETNDYILDYRIIVDREQKEIKTEKVETLNHIDKFVQFIHSNLGCSDVIDSELENILK